VIQGFIDDSGGDGRSPVFVLAGYVAKAEQWEAFTDEWQKVLDYPDPTPIKFLKTNQIYRNNVPNTDFYGWTDKQRDARLKMFIAAIRRHVLHGIVSVVPMEPYERLMKGKFNLAMLDRPYFLSFFGILINLLKLTHDLKLDDKLDLIFDEQNVRKEVLAAEFDKCMALAPPELHKLCGGMPIFGSDHDALPLQAADMLAWHARRYYYDECSGKNPVNEASNVFFAHMFDLKHDIFDFWTEPRLVEVHRALMRGGKTL